MDLIELPAEKVPHEDISMREIRKKAVVTERKYEIERKEVSKNINAFDKKPRVFKENPYSFNAISLGKSQTYTPSASEMVANPLYNAVGKALGLDTAKEWNQYYDKVYAISEWAKKKTNGDIQKTIKLIAEKSRVIPSMGARRIDDIYIHIGLTK